MKTFYLFASVALFLALGGPARAADDGTAVAVVTFQQTGPRPGAAGKTFLNVEGKDNGKYSAFGVLDFKPAKPEKPAAKVAKLTLTLTQSIARFSKDGGLKIAVAADTATALGEGSPLKFDPKAEGGVGTQLGALLPIGPATFTKRETGDKDSVTLTPTGEAEALILKQVNAGGVVRLVVTPADDVVAATYFGLGAEEAGQKPKLAVETAP